MTATKRLRVTGRVQGVGFRFYMQRKAHELGVTGWVRNRRDGSVEAVIHGKPEAVAALINWTRRGPDSAVVAELGIEDADGTYAAFVTRPTE